MPFGGEAVCDCKFNNETGFQDNRNDLQLEKMFDCDFRMLLTVSNLRDEWLLLQL